MPIPPSSTSIVTMSKTIIYPSTKSTMKPLKLSVSDLPMLSCHYIQKGVLLSLPPLPTPLLMSLLRLSLAETLSIFPPLAGQLSTDSLGQVLLLSNHSGVDFIHSTALHLSVNHILSPNVDIHPCFKKFFPLDTTLSYAGHSKPILAVQVTELADGLFIGCAVNHAVVDGTSLWNFFNTFAEITRAAKKITRPPHFGRQGNAFQSPVVLPIPAGGPSATFSGDEPLRERIFHFTRDAILKLKFIANVDVTAKPSSEILAKPNSEISSFQSLCALLWRCVTRARTFDDDLKKTTTFRMAVNCRHRLEPRVEPLYFGNLIQSIPTIASVGELLSHDISWGANLLHQNVVAHDDNTIRKGIKDWESNPRMFPLGNFDGAMITMGSSPRFPMYDNDFGWGKPLAVRSGVANKFDGKISAFPGREGNGSVDLEVVLAPNTMSGLESDMEFMHYVS